MNRGDPFVRISGCLLLIVTFFLLLTLLPVLLILSLFFPLFRPNILFRRMPGFGPFSGNSDPGPQTDETVIEAEVIRTETREETEEGASSHTDPSEQQRLSE